nr:MAG TPA: hypothetical protein [Caudoviricetes sp.]
MQRETSKRQKVIYNFFITISIIYRLNRNANDTNLTSGRFISMLYCY